jgi:hypothetical protein
MYTSLYPGGPKSEEADENLSDGSSDEESGLSEAVSTHMKEDIQTRRLSEVSGSFPIQN